MFERCALDLFQIENCKILEQRKSFRGFFAVVRHLRLFDLFPKYNGLAYSSRLHIIGTLPDMGTQRLPLPLSAPPATCVASEHQHQIEQ